MSHTMTCNVWCGWVLLGSQGFFPWATRALLAAGQKRRLGGANIDAGIYVDTVKLASTDLGDLSILAETGERAKHLMHSPAS